MDELVLTPEQEEEAERIADILRARSAVEITYISRLLASKENCDLLGRTEFQIRDAVHRLGAAGIDAALHERKKRGIADPAASARTATKMRASRDTGSAS